MPEIAFHFNAPDKLAYTCRLLRKAVGAGSRVVVTGPAALLERLDTLLWTFSQGDFVAHARVPGAELVVQASPVLLAENPAQNLPHKQVLLNLGDDTPAGVEDYQRVIEVVSLDESDRQQARGRWRYYTEQGYAIVRHDLNLKGSA